MSQDKEPFDRWARYALWVAKLGLTEEQAARANEERFRLLASLTDDRVHYGFGRTKIHTGNLSPGCVTCGQGTWSCLYINRLCTAHCFYCPQNRDVRGELSSRVGKLSFDEPDTYMDYLQMFSFKGVSISGGEPLMVFDKVLSFVERVKQCFGNEVHVWLYTNGDLVQKGRLQQLLDAGLDEIRFHIAVRDYDLQRVALAREILPTVTVEIPAIPEDYEKLKQSLAEMQEIGVDHLNLHQLTATTYNYQAFISRGYTILPPAPLGEPTVLESEMTALRLVEYALERDIRVPINYCSHVYKARYQSLAGRRRVAPMVQEGWERITDAGYLCRLSITDSAVGLEQVAGVLKGQVPGDLWSVNAAAGEIYLQPSALQSVKLPDARFTLSYFESAKAWAGDPTIVKEVPINSFTSFFLKKELVGQSEKLSATGIEMFLKIFLDHQEADQVFRDYGVDRGGSAHDLQKEVQILKQLQVWEQLEAGLQEIH